LDKQVHIKDDKMRSRRCLDYVYSRNW